MVPNLKYGILTLVILASMAVGQTYATNYQPPRSTAYSTSQASVGQEQSQQQAQGQAQVQGQVAATNTEVETGDSLIINKSTWEMAASSAANLYSAGCQSGMSAQVLQGGMSSIEDDITCQYFRLADATRQRYLDSYARDLGQCDENERERRLQQAFIKGGDSLLSPIPCLMSEETSAQWDTVQGYLDQAEATVDHGRVTAEVQGVAADVGKTALWVGLIVWLIILI